MNRYKENKISEKELIEHCIADDRKYQEIFYKRFAPTMYRICQNYATDRDEAMDFLQEGFIAVFDNLHKYRFEGSLEGWIKKVIIYKIIDLLRGKKRYYEALAKMDNEQFDEQEEFELENAQISAEKIKNLVNYLPEKASLVLKLYALEGYTHKEIAEILNISVGTSKSQLNRARKMLKAALINIK